jgi:hypothetical protein
MWRLVGMALLACVMAALLGHDSAVAQSNGRVYTGQANIYRVDIPAGWSEVDGGDNVDAAFAPAGGRAYGSIFVGVMYARRSLDEEVDRAAGNDATQGRRHLSINGMPFGYLASTGGRGERNNHLACQFTAPFSGGARKVTFFMGSASRPQDYAAQTDVFWRMANSLRWAPEITADTDTEDDGDDQTAQGAEDAPGTWVLYVSPPGTGNADTLPPYDEWKVFQRYQGLADCLAARMPAHMKYWDSDQDLSMRMLHAICFNPDTREIRGAR